MENEIKTIVISGPESAYMIRSCLRVISDNDINDIDGLESAIGLKPDYTIKKGQYERTGAVAEKSYAHFNITDYIESDDFINIIVPVENHFAKVKDQVKSYLDNNALTIKFIFIVRHSEGWPFPAAWYPSSFIKLCASLGAEIELDVY